MCLTKPRISYNGKYNINTYLWCDINFYVVTWNVKTYVSHPLKCRMCQNWLKWCSDPPPPPTTTPKLQLDFLDLKSSWSLGVVVGGGGGLAPDPPTTTPKLKLDFLDLKSSWSLGVVVGGSDARHPPPPPTTTPKLQLDFLDLEKCWNMWRHTVVARG